VHIFVGLLTPYLCYIANQLTWLIWFSSS